MPNLHEPLLVNMVGHFAGSVIFGIFLYLMFRDRSGTRLRGSWLSFAAAGLALLWNVGSLAVLIASNINSRYADLIIFFCFAVLSLLPAVLLDLSLGGRFRSIIASGYVLSVIAVSMHLWEVFQPDLHFHELALLLITVGFGALTAVSVIAVAWSGDKDERAKASRIFGAMCSMLLAMSFVHFGTGHPSQIWSRELALHHAGIPLALFVLLQDYRFVLLDAFIRFLANALLAALVTFVAIGIGFRFLVIDQGLLRRPLQESLLLLGFCSVLIAFALLRGQVQRWLTKVVFRRVELNKALQEMQSRAALFSDEAQFRGWAAGQLAEFMSADRVEEVSESSLAEILGDADLFLPVPASDVPRLRHAPAFAWVQAIVPLPLGRGEVSYLLLGRRRGGRRYLSEDLRSLSRLSAIIVEQVNRIRSREMHRLVSQAELRALQSQINPHFLFNALNTLYGIIPREAAGARKTVLNLAEIFRYFLQSEKSFIPLSDELEIVKAYLDIERLRVGPRLEVELDIDEAALAVPIPILSIQPLVENAIKHGISGKAGPGLLRLKAKVVDDELVIAVEDTGRGMASAEDGFDRSHAGVGLNNVQRRLQLCYGPDAGLRIDSNSEGTKVELGIPLARTAPA